LIVLKQEKSIFFGSGTENATPGNETIDKNRKEAPHSFADALRMNTAMCIMALPQQIKKSRKKKKITQGELAKMLGKTKNVISNWERGDNKPDADTILSLCRILDTTPNSIMDWEDDGKSLSEVERYHIEKFRALEPWQQNLVDEMINKILDHSNPENLDLPQSLSIPFFQVSPAAGAGNYLGDDVEQETIELPDTALNRKIDYVLRVDGHSMEPKYMDGDLVKIASQPSVNIGEIGIFIIDGNSFIKEYRANSLHSLNPEYPDIEFTPGMDIRCVGKVLGAI